jgi:hypothetical protein
MRAIGIGCLLLALLLAAGCAERRSPTESQVHPSSWNDPNSTSFHGPRVRADGPGICRSCHGGDLRGEAGVVGCFACHSGSGGHPDGWERPASASFHGHSVEAMGPSGCADCHGGDYSGGWSGVACSSCHGAPPGGQPPGQSGHPLGWMTRESASFHGYEVQTEGVTDCTRCHGFGLSGGTSGVGCAKCHG